MSNTKRFPCPRCDSKKTHYTTSSENLTVIQCRNCGEQFDIPAIESGQYEESHNNPNIHYF